MITRGLKGGVSWLIRDQVRRFQTHKHRPTPNLSNSNKPLVAKGWSGGFVVATIRHTFTV